MQLIRNDGGRIIPAIFVVIVNIFIFFTLSIVADFALGRAYNEPVAYLCRDPVLHHVHCPGATRLYKLDAIDGGRTITSFWNLDGIRVPTSLARSTVFDTREFDVVLVGDSFMEQRQVGYDERVSRLLEMRTGAKALQVGTGSWAPASYRNWIVHHKFKKGAKVAIFIMANDLYPLGYGMSNLQYHNAAVSVDGEPQWPEQVETFASSLKRFLINNSYFFQWRFNRQLARSLRQTAQEHSVLHFDRNNLADCGALDLILGSDHLTPYAKSVAIQAFKPECWPPLMNANVASVASDIAAIRTHLAAQQVQLFVFFIPNGWVMQGEASVAAASSEYQIDPATIIPASGVVEGLRAVLGVDVTSFEDAMKAEKTRRGEVESHYYYANDAHWNALGSSVAADIIATTLGLSPRISMESGQQK